MKPLISLTLVATAMVTTTLAAIDITPVRPLYTAPVVYGKPRHGLQDVDMNTVLIIGSDNAKTVATPIQARADKPHMVEKPKHHKVKKPKGHRRHSVEEEEKEKAKKEKEKQKEHQKREEHKKKKEEELAQIEHMKLMEEYSKAKVDFDAYDSYPVTDDDEHSLWWGGGWGRGGWGRGGWGGWGGWGRGGWGRGGWGRWGRWGRGGWGRRW
ncbi:hypothetical protein DFQ27_004150 [Actinomortierella ambigua]|uniref:Uncharacterized protein n=1 Tax=Actinomortierella ambigua TaxID=1343610 RepID=A0A9P6QLQ1_9FUNG|nr:hypothetical protein DFQ27_004150 [Actinomortierella ambigua]